MPRRSVGPALGILVLGLLLAACSSSPPLPSDMAEGLPASPLPPCPGTPNCVHHSRAFDADADAVFARARAALEHLGPARLDVDAGARRMDAVFTVFLFKDDVQLIVAPRAEGAVLHIRSASRVGRSDLGVNRRRVRRFFEALDASS